jgi:hypothetical protein
MVSVGERHMTFPPASFQYCHNKKLGLCACWGGAHWLDGEMSGFLPRDYEQLVTLSGSFVLFVFKQIIQQSREFLAVTQVPAFC